MARQNYATIVEVEKVIGEQIKNWLQNTSRTAAIHFLKAIRYGLWYMIFANEFRQNKFGQMNLVKKGQMNLG